MSQPETDVIAQAQEYIRSKQLPKAQRLLVEYIKKNPNSEQAWYVLSTAVDDPGKQIECLQRVLRLNPANKEAQTRLMSVMAPQAASAPAPRATGATARSQRASRRPASRHRSARRRSNQQSRSANLNQSSRYPWKPQNRSSPRRLWLTPSSSSLRSKARYVKPRKPRKRWPRIVILLLLILLAASVGAYLVLNNLNQAAIPPAEGTPAGAMAVVPTDTPTLIAYAHGDADAVDYAHALPADVDAHASANRAAHSHADTAADA